MNSSSSYQSDFLDYIFSPKDKPTPKLKLIPNEWAKPKKENPVKENYTGVLVYDSDGNFIKYYKDFENESEVTDKKSIINSIVTRSMLEGFAYIYAPQNGVIPDKIDVAKFRRKNTKRAKVNTPEIVEKYLKMRRGGRAARLKKVFEAKGYSGINFIFGILRNGQGIVRVSPTLLVVSDEYLSTEESVLVDLITPKLSEITRIDFVAQRINFKKKDGNAGLLFASIEDGLVFAKTIKTDYEIIGVKQCWQCGKYQNADKFVRSHDTGDGLTHECRKCIERYDFLWGSGWTARHNGATPIMLNKMKRNDKPHFSGINNSVEKF